MKQLLTTLLFVMLAVGATLAQRTVVGTVTSNDGEALIGASVIVKGASAGTRTDINGKYSLPVPSGYNTLTFAYTGYETQEITLGASNVVDLTLAENATIKEVVVTAIGIQRDKKALGYSISDIKGDQLQQRSEGDMLRSLTSKAPGVNIQAGGGAPGQSTKINIRGYSSLTGNTQPLFVVDGVPFDNSVNATSGAAGGTQYSNRAFDIDPNNIESMTVLKGAAASALYGSRATNGVVIITTKSGAKSRKGLEVTFNSSMSWEQITALPKYQEKYSQGSNQAYNAAFIGNWGAPFGAYANQLNDQYFGTNYAKVDSVLLPIPNITNTARYTNFYPELVGKKVPFTNYDFLTDFFQTGQLRENSINIAGGNETSNISATVSRMDNEGIVNPYVTGQYIKGWTPGYITGNKGQSLAPKSSRTTVALGGSSKLANGLTLNASVNYVNTHQETPPIGGSVFGGNFGTAEGSIFTRLYFLPRNYNLLNYPFERAGDGGNVFYRNLENPLWLFKNNRYTSDLNRVFGTVGLTYDVTSWLSLTAKGGINTYSERRTNISSPGQTFAFDLDGGVSVDNLVNSEADFNYFATITKDLNRNFNMRLIGGVNHNQRQFRRDLTVGDVIISRGVNNLEATQKQISIADDDDRLQRFYAFYGDLSVSFKNSIYLGAVVRNDYSSTLPKDNQGYVYGGLNGSWVITEMIKNRPTFLDFAKVRASYAVVGNEATPYRLQTVYRINQPFTTAGGTAINQATLGNVKGNPNLVNELTKEIEFGTDLRLFRNRIGIDLTWFRRSSTNQITSALVPASTGFRQAIVNAGEIENKGIELGLTLSPLKSERGLNWENYFAFTRIRSTVIDAGEGDNDDIILLAGGGGNSGVLGTIMRTGQPYGALYGTQAARDADGSLLVDKTTGNILGTPDGRIIGNPNPDFTLGWTSTFSFRGFYLSTLFDWRQGGDFYSTTAGSLTLRGQLSITEDREGTRVIPGYYGDPSTLETIKNEQGQPVPNTTSISAFSYFFTNFGPYGPDDTNIYDGTVLRFRELSAGYNFPKKWLKRTPIGSARVSVSGRNLWFRTPNLPDGLNLDPEVLGETADSNVLGFEYGAFPTTKRYGVNLSVTF